MAIRHVQNYAEMPKLCRNGDGIGAAQFGADGCGKFLKHMPAAILIRGGSLWNCSF